jgi:regulator of protease activity HflC (stomatin/prohibitin superfamily)
VRAGTTGGREADMSVVLIVVIVLVVVVLVGLLLSSVHVIKQYERAV